MKPCNAARVLSPDEVFYVSGGWSPEEDNLLAPIFKKIKDLIDPGPQARIVNALEDAGWDCIQQNDDSVVCYDESRDHRTVVPPEGGGTVSPYQNK